MSSPRASASASGSRTCPTISEIRWSAAFDTRVAPARVPGSAAKGIAKRLRSHGYDLVLDPRTFWVEGTPGPLVDGEIDKAREWGMHLRVALPLSRAN